MKEKAKELIESFYLCMPMKDVKLTSCSEKPELIIKMEKLSAKQCALICVDEILKYHESLFITEGSIAYRYWQDIKSEINNL